MLLVLLLTALTSLVFAGLFIYQTKYKHLIDVTQNIPSPPTLPIIGHGHYFVGKPPHVLMMVIRDIMEKYGNTVKIWIGPELNIMMSNVRDVELVLSSMAFNDKAGEYKMLEPWLQEGLLVSRGKKWHKRRKVITPAFHFKILDKFFDIFEHGSRTLINNLETEMKIEQPSGINLYDWINLCTLDTICGPELNIVLADVRDIEVVLGTTRLNDKASEYKFLENWLREGLLISRDRKWFQRRKILTPAFHFQILAQFVEIFERGSRGLIVNLEKEQQKNEKQKIILNHWFSLCTLDGIAETAMGVSVNAQTNADSEYVRAVKTIATVLHKRMFDILYRFDLTYRFTKLAREEQKALNILHSFTEKIIIQRRKELLKTKDADGDGKEAEEDIGVKRKMAFLDILLQSEIDGKPLTNLDIREEVDTFMFEGHDTTSSAITFFFYNIALYPECQQRCFEEIRNIMGNDKSTPVTYDNLNNMHYIELCIKETLRLFPSVPILGRKVTKECEINGKIIPAGTNLGISPLHLGRLEELFPEPLVFKPERFDVVTSADKMNPYAYIPFSAGPRNCIGQKFAMLEIKTVVANVLRSFEVTYAGNPNEEPLLIGELILRTKDPLMFYIKPRVY